MTQPGGETGTPANSGEGAPTGIPANLFTQEQLNSVAAQSKREAVTKYFKELGFDAVPTADDLKGTLSKASEFDKLQDGQKNEVQRLTEQLSSEKEKSAKVPTLELELQRAKIAADAGLKSKYWKYIEGDTPEDIAASVKDTLADFNQGGTQGNDGDQGGGQGGEGSESGGSGMQPNPQQGAGSGGGTAKKSTLSAGAEAYKAKHGKKE
jgi:hypothetical protein